MTMIMGVLIVDVWFYYSKSLNCCIEIRSLLDDGSGDVCPPAIFTLPCRRAPRPLNTSTAHAN